MGGEVRACVQRREQKRMPPVLLTRGPPPTAARLVRPGGREQEGRGGGESRAGELEVLGEQKASKKAVETQTGGRVSPPPFASAKPLEARPTG
jgi:hypothetical protein